MTKDVAIQINELGAARFIGGSSPPNLVFGVSSRLGWLAAVEHGEASRQLVPHRRIVLRAGV